MIVNIISKQSKSSIIKDFPLLSLISDSFSKIINLPIPVLTKVKYEMLFFDNSGFSL